MKATKKSHFVLSLAVCLCSCISFITFRFENIIKPFFEAEDGYNSVSLLNI